MRTSLYLLGLFILFSFSYQAQNLVSWKIVDAENKRAVAFVNVLINNSNQGTSSDIDGEFSLSPNLFDSLTFSSIGYKLKTLNKAELLKSKTIYLNPNTYKLKEVEILPGENPAHRIINLAIEKREQNNPEKATEFYYESYNKLVFTMETDSLQVSNPASLTPQDSDIVEMKQFFDQQHLFMMESVTERNHIPPSFSKEVVTASRVSGLQNPMFSLIGTQLQSFSLYNTYISLFGENYLSPISKESTKKYLFILEDTLYRGDDTVFTMSFQPRKGKNFSGLKGSISINTNNYAVENFIAEQAEAVTVKAKIQQKYEFVANQQWFPVQLNTKLTFSEIEVYGEEMLGIGRSYLKNIQLQSKLNKREIGNTILEMDNKAGKKDSTFWSAQRKEALTEKEKETYHFMDSIGQEENLDQKVAIYSTLIRGSVPLGPVDLPLKYLLDYNGYEGLRLGLGVETNEKLIPWLRFGGYGAYGFKDKAGKYGYHTRFTPKSNRELELKVSYKNDVAEVGGTSFTNDRQSRLSSETYQRFFLNRMDEVEKIQAEIGFRAMRDFHFTAFANTEERTFTSDYNFVPNSIEANSTVFNSYQLSQFGLQVRYSFREKYAKMFGVKVPVKSKYPVVFLKLTKGLEGPFGGDYDFLKANFKIDQSFVIRNLGKSSIRISGGFIDSELPLGILYRTAGTFDSKYRIASSYSFETATPNEFYNDRYLHIFFRHSFGNLLFKSELVKPEISLVSSFGIGDMKNQDAHSNIDFETLDKGLFESGVQIDNLLESFGLGVGAFYRYGAYQKTDWEDNVAVKITSVFNF